MRPSLLRPRLLRPCLLRLCLLLAAAADWVEITQRHYKKPSSSVEEIYFNSSDKINSYTKKHKIEGNRNVASTNVAIPAKTDLDAELRVKQEHNRNKATRDSELKNLPKLPAKRHEDGNPINEYNHAKATGIRRIYINRPADEVIKPVLEKSKENTATVTKVSKDELTTHESLEKFQNTRKFPVSLKVAGLSLTEIEVPNSDLQMSGEVNKAFKSNSNKSNNKSIVQESASTASNTPAVNQRYNSKSNVRRIYIRKPEDHTKAEITTIFPHLDSQEVDNYKRKGMIVEDNKPHKGTERDFFQKKKTGFAFDDSIKDTDIESYTRSPTQLLDSGSGSPTIPKNISSVDPFAVEESSTKKAIRIYITRKPVTQANFYDYDEYEIAHHTKQLEMATVSAPIHITTAAPHKTDMRTNRDILTKHLIVSNDSPGHRRVRPKIKFIDTTLAHEHKTHDISTSTETFAPADQVTNTQIPLLGTPDSYGFVTKDEVNSEGVILIETDATTTPTPPERAAGGRVDEAESDEDVKGAPGGRRPGSADGVVRLLRAAAASLARLARGPLRRKVTLLRNLQDDLLANIKERIDFAWPDDAASAAAPRARRAAAAAAARGHVDFPSSEGALMTISFLTFAVFLIKLVLQVIQKYKNPSMFVAPTVVSVGGRLARAWPSRPAPQRPASLRPTPLN